MLQQQMPFLVFDIQCAQPAVALEIPPAHILSNSYYHQDSLLLPIKRMWSAFPERLHSLLDLLMLALSSGEEPSRSSYSLDFCGYERVAYIHLCLRVFLLNRYFFYSSLIFSLSSDILRDVRRSTAEAECRTPSHGWSDLSC